MDYSQASYFDGYAFAHIAAWDEHIRLATIRKRCRDYLRRG